MTAPLTDIGEMIDRAKSHYKRKYLLQKAILKYLGIDNKSI